MRYTLIFIVSIFISGCSNSLIPSEYLKWIGDTENGLIKTKEIGGLKLSVKYIPNDYLVYKDIKTQKLIYSKELKDSLLNSYNGGVAFLLTLGTTENINEDIMMADVVNKEEFTQRVMDMNFNIKEYISLELENKEIEATLVSLDNIYGLKNERSVYVLFSDEKKIISNSDKIIFVYNDQLFNTGTSKFSYLASDIKSIPNIDYNSIK